MLLFMMTLLISATGGHATTDIAKSISDKGYSVAIIGAGEYESISATAVHHSVNSHDVILMVNDGNTSPYEPTEIECSGNYGKVTRVAISSYHGISSTLIDEDLSITRLTYKAAPKIDCYEYSYDFIHWEYLLSKGSDYKQRKAYYLNQRSLLTSNKANAPGLIKHRKEMLKNHQRL